MSKANAKARNNSVSIIDCIWFYYSQGFSVIPLGENRGFWNNKVDDLKKPSLKSWDKYKNTRATKEEIQQWIDEGLFKNIGVICGHVSNNLVIIDIDDETIPEILGLKVEKIFESGAWFSKTGKGYQIWLRHHGNPGGIRRLLKYKIEYRANNGYCVVPPSTHPNGKNYYFIGVKDYNELPELVEKDVKSIFNDFKKKIGKKWNIKETKHVIKGATDTDALGDYPKCVEIALSTITKHPMRYYTIYGIASSFSMKKIPQDMAMKKLKEFNMKKCVPPHETHIVEQAVRGAYEPNAHHYGCEFWMDDAELCPYENIMECPYGQKKAKRELLKEYKVFLYKKKEDKESGEKYYVINDVNCPRLAKLLMNGDEGIYVTVNDNQEIYKYNGKIYEETAKSYIESRINFYLDDETTDYRKREVISYMKGENIIPRETLDGANNLLPLENGIYDLEKKKLIEYSPDYFFTHYLPVKYNPTAKINKIQTFFEDILPLDYIPVLQQFFGDCLLTDYRYKKAVLCAGPKNTGKSTLLNLLKKFLGEQNISHVSLYNLCMDKYATAELYKKRANIYAQIEAVTLTKINMFLMLTGMDAVRAREIYKAAFYFVNFAKLIFSCNNIPSIELSKAITDAYYIRWIVFPFTQVFENEVRDVNILDKLTSDEEEMSGLLNWALEGLNSLEKNNGYLEVMDINETKEFMEKGTNPIREFVDAYITKSSGRECVSDVYKCYIGFCKENNYPYVNDVWFSRKALPLCPMGMRTGHTRKGRYWDGIVCNFHKEYNENEGQKKL